MVLNDPLASVLSKINNAEKVGKDAVTVSPVSSQLKRVLSILQDQQYVGSFEESEDRTLVIHLLHTINRVGVIKPRFSFTNAEYEKVEKRYLPAKDFGVIIVTTSKGIMTLDEAKTLQIGGKLIAYCY
ncbi:MAG: 30S ribosomal protein S8 [Candidatus Woesearchaeota archaeon]